MGKSLDIKYGIYVSKLISCVANNSAVPAPFEDIDWEKLYDFSIEQNVSTLILPAISKLPVPTEVFEKFDKDQYRKMAREAKIAIESQKVFDALTEAKLNYIKMKGIVIKDVYPLSYMRTFGDVDLYLGSEGRDKVKPIMEKLGYTIEHSNDSHDEYEKDFFAFEMHSHILPKTAFYKDVLKNPFEHSENDGDNPYSFVLKPDYFYLHLITHLYKHFAYGGCGIRLYCDIYLFFKARPEIDLN